MKNWETVEPDKVAIVSPRRYTKGRSRKIDCVVIHHNAGVRNTTEYLKRLWDNEREASAHYQVEADGTIGQLVWDRDTAWHAPEIPTSTPRLTLAQSVSSTLTLAGLAAGKSATKQSRRALTSSPLYVNSINWAGRNGALTYSLTRVSRRPHAPTSSHQAARTTITT